MKRITIVAAFLLSFCFSKAQSEFDYGISIICNLSSQTNYNPLLPEDGTFQWNSLGAAGAGFIVGKSLTNKLYWSNRILYQQKGYIEKAQTASVFEDFQTPLSYHTLQNRFNYMTFETKIGYHVFHFGFVKITPYSGITFNYLTKAKIESESVDPINSCYPTSEYKNNWKKFTPGYNLGFSCSLQDKINIGFEFQRSISPLLATNNLIVKDWTWSVTMDIMLSQILSVTKNQ